MILAIAAILTVGAVVFTLLIRSSDLPEAPPVSPTAHLEERRERIYESLRDLQFEYRVGKLSDEDYQRTKLDLQRELAGVLAEIENCAGASEAAPNPTAAAAAPAPLGQKQQRSKGLQCPHCNAKFDRRLKFCGECGKPMQGESA